MVVFAGIDLAWSGRRPTGTCIIEIDGDRPRLLELSCTDSSAAAGEIVRLLEALGSDVVAGVDAPLIVSPERRAEAELARAFGRQGVYAYAARPDFLERHSIQEGPRLGSLLVEAGWNLDPSEFVAKPAGRHAFEVFPHATTVSLLGSPFALKYKKGSISSRLGPLATFQGLLRDYAQGELPCLLGAAADDILERPIGPQSGVALKAIEDKLDAICCAITAHHAWKFGPARLTTFGDAVNGYIAVPKLVTSFLARSSP